MKYEDRCREIETAFAKIEQDMADPAIASDPAKYREVAKNHRDLSRVLEKWRDYQAASSSNEDALTLGRRLRSGIGRNGAAGNCAQPIGTDPFGTRDFTSLSAVRSSG